MVRYLITAALPYSQALPHLGNMAGSIIPADVYHRYLQLKRCDSIFICGSDQHGTAIEVEAIKQNKPTHQLADEMHIKIKQIFERFECSFSYYGKTHCEKNKEMTYLIFDALYKNRLIIEKESIMPFCETDKRFLADRLIEGTCPVCKRDHARGDQCDDCGALLDPKDLINPHCRICGGMHISFVKTKNLAIDLAALQPKIKKLIMQRKKNGWSANAANKALSYIEQGLKPREITRELKWGFAVPLKGFEDKVIYVWFDALIAYIGITAEWDQKQMHSYWFDDKQVRLVQFMGKDNIEFHTLMWPAILIGADMQLTMPYIIKAYEHLSSKSVKFSKSRGIGLNAQNALDILGADYWRFALVHMLPESADSEFSVDLLVEVINKIMNDKIGNLAHRVLTLIKNNKIAVGDRYVPKQLRAKINKLVRQYKQHMEALQFRAALQTAVTLADLGNALMSNAKPWELIANKQAHAKLSGIMSALAYITYCVSVMLWPIVPRASSRALEYFSLGQQEMPSLEMMGALPQLNLERELTPMFRKLSERELAELERFANV